MGGVTLANLLFPSFNILSHDLFYYTLFILGCQQPFCFVKFKLFVNFIKIARAGVVKYYYICYNIYNYVRDTTF